MVGRGEAVSMGGGETYRKSSELGGRKARCRDVEKKERAERNGERERQDDKKILTTKSERGGGDNTRPAARRGGEKKKKRRHRERGILCLGVKRASLGKGQGNHTQKKNTKQQNKKKNQRSFLGALRKQEERNGGESFKREEGSGPISFAHEGLPPKKRKEKTISMDTSNKTKHQIK